MRTYLSTAAALACLAMAGAAQTLPPTLAMTYPGFPPPLVATWVPGQTGYEQWVTIPQDVECSAPCYGGGWGTFDDGRVIWIRGWNPALGTLRTVRCRIDATNTELDYAVECLHETQPLGVVVGGANLEANLTFGHPLEWYPGHQCDNIGLGYGLTLCGTGEGWGWDSPYLTAFDGIADFGGTSGFWTTQGGWYPPFTATGDQSHYGMRQMISTLPVLPIYFVPTWGIGAQHQDGTPINWGHGATFHWGGRVRGPITIRVTYVP